MKGRTNTTGVEEGSGFNLIDEGWYFVSIVKVVDSQTKNNDYMARVEFNIIEGKHKGRKIWDNIVISNNPGSPGYKILGRAKHFLHVIGEPYEGDIEFDTDRWVFEQLRVNICYEEYKGVTRAKISEFDFKDEPVNVEETFGNQKL